MKEYVYCDTSLVPVDITLTS